MKKKKTKDKGGAGADAEEEAPKKKEGPPPPLWTKALPALMGLVLVLFAGSGLVSGEVHVPKRGGSAGVVTFHSSPVAFVLTEVLVFGVGGLLTWGGASGAFAPDMTED